MKAFLVSLSAAAWGLASAVAGPYAPAAGQAGSTAISASSSSFHGWATGVVELIRGPQDISNPASDLASFGSDDDALGKANATIADPNPVVSLGDGGHITLSFYAADYQWARCGLCRLREWVCG